MENISEIIFGRRLHGEGGEADKDQTLNNVCRICGIVVILIIGFIFGMIPFFW